MFLDTPGRANSSSVKSHSRSHENPWFLPSRRRLQIGSVWEDKRLKTASNSQHKDDDDRYNNDDHEWRR